MKNTKVFLVVIPIVVAAIVVSILLLSTPPEDEEPTQIKPIYVRLTWQTDDTAHTITVTWQTLTADSGDTVLYDTVPRDGDSTLYRFSKTGTNHTYTGASGHIHDVELTDLSPDTTYYFICGGETGGWAEERAFKTAPAASSHVRFVAGGDCRTNHDARDKVTQAMSVYNPEFVIFNGDIVENGDNQNLWENFFAHMDAYMVGSNNLTIPFMPAVGNHENPYYSYYQQFALPDNEPWYSIDYGPDIHIIVLDSERDHLAATQQAWLEEDLREHASSRWKFVMFHKNVFPSRHDAYQPAYDYWVPIFDKYHVDIVFNGHSHLYSRTKPINWTTSTKTAQPSYRDGTMYVIAGSWGAPLRDDPYANEWWVAHYSSIYHFVLVDIFENGTLHLQAIDDTGTTFDEVRIHKAAQIGMELIDTPTEEACRAIAVTGEQRVSSMYSSDPSTTNVPSLCFMNLMFALLVLSVKRKTAQQF